MEKLTNHALFCGTVSQAPQYSHDNHGRRFYQFPLEICRLSGTVDTLSVLAAEDVLARCDITGGTFIRVEGQIRSFNSRNDTGRKLIISVYADRVENCDGEPENDVTLVGTVCKTPNFRRTPLGREICDLMLAVPRRYYRTDYIPCILWGRTAQEIASLTAGCRLELHGRLQSRNYLKVLEDCTEERTAYEVSVMDAYILPES